MQSGEVDSIGEQQAEVDAARSDHARLYSAHQGTRYCTRRQSRGLRQTHAGVDKEVRRQKHNYVCSKERTVVRPAVLIRIEVRAPSTSAPRRVAGAGVIKGCIRCRLCPGDMIC